MRHFEESILANGTNGKVTELVQFRGGKIPTEGVQMHPPSLFLKALSRAASEEYSLNIGRGARGASLIEYRGCIVILYHFDW